MPEDDQKPERPEFGALETIKHLFSFVKLDKRIYLLVIVLAVFGSLAAMISPLIVQQSVDAIVARRPFDEIIGLIIVLGAIAAIEAVISTANSYALSYLGIEAMYGVRNRMFQHLQKLSLTYFHTTKTGKIISYVTNDVETVNSLISIGLVTVIVQLFQLVASVFFMLSLSWQMTLLPLAIMPLNMFFLVFFSKRSRSYFQVIRKTISTMTGQAQESIDGFRTIKSHKSEAAVLAKFDAATRAERDAMQHAAPIWAVMQPVFTAITFISIGGCVLLGGFLYFSGFIANIGLIFAFIMYLLTFLGPISSLATFLSDVQNAVVGAGRVLRLLGTEPDMHDPAKPVQLGTTVQGAIDFDHVHFAYDGTDVLRDVVLHVNPKERLAIVGPTGSGKTTIISLIPRFYDVKAGSVRIDGVDVRDLEMQDLRKRVGLVLQDNFLFATSIMENIKYGKLGASNDDVIDAAKKVGAHEFIEQLPRKYETQVGERGAILSIGQRQLIAFARTLLADPPVLILDEATSSVDAYSEILIQKNLEKLLANRTSIIIAHRLSTVVNADTIVVLQDGKIIQRGNHVQLVQDEGGLYKKLYEMQFAEGNHN